MTQSQDEQYVFESLLGPQVGDASRTVCAAELSEGEVSELASALQHAETEEELDHLLPAFLPSAKLVAGGLSELAQEPGAKSAIRQVASLLKNVATEALPKLRQVDPLCPVCASEGEQFLGDLVGGLINSDTADPREFEFEAAKQLVRFGNAALCRALLAARQKPPTEAARSALVSAARTHAPGLLRRRCSVCAKAGTARVAPMSALGTNGHPTAGVAHRRSGRWFRHGSNVVLTG
jgi:hypothetical protein